MDQSVVGPGVPLTDAQWARIEPLLPDRTPKRGGRWRDHREVIGAIAHTFQTGTQYVHLPEKHGNWRGVYNRLRMWAAAGCRACAPHRGHGGRPGRGRNHRESLNRVHPTSQGLMRVLTSLHRRSNPRLTKLAERAGVPF
ncbi:transposase [Streptomyces sp. PRh5]|uniref:transposase n=1 Tax=Streptomyces sp. PRh5 TaxID=1158056 RepID=UPI000D13854F|nr:transposase [Streptomyces sp. PRh5]